MTPIIPCRSRSDRRLGPSRQGPNTRKAELPFLGLGGAGRLIAGRAWGRRLFEILLVEVFDHRLGDVIFIAVIHNLPLQLPHDIVGSGRVGGRTVEAKNQRVAPGIGSAFDDTLDLAVDRFEQLGFASQDPCSFGLLERVEFGLAFRPCFSSSTALGLPCWILGELSLSLIVFICLTIAVR